MALRIDETLEAFVDRMSRNNKLMEILHLPTVLANDTNDIKLQKRKKIIDKIISKSSQEPIELNKKFPEIIINGKTYKEYGDIRITVSLAQSIKMHEYYFDNPQVDISIYYDNTKMNNVFKVLDLISDEFSGDSLEVKLEDGKQLLRNLKCEGITSQVAIINNFERVGIRFSFYTTLYK